MCGIAGLLYLDKRPVEHDLLRRMGEAIAHRGPDGQGTFVDGSLGLAHRRLAILDLSPAAHQPMHTRDGRYVISYNGEIYNFQELKSELEAFGHQFNSRSDTEVVLQGFQRWGEKLFPRLNGMFAFAIWDKKKRKLTLARDRYGIKPLYYWSVGAAFLFASEVKAMMVEPSFKVEMDFQGLMEYMTFQNYLSDRNLFKNVKLLQPGCSLVIGIDGKSTINRYWDFNFREPDSSFSAQEYEEELDRLFQQAVNRQIVSDVTVGSYLSGGIDSGSISAIASRKIKDLQTYTIGFDLNSASGLEMGMDERSSSEYMSYIFKTEHYEMVLKAGDMERCIDKLVWHMEEPRIGQSYPNYYAAKLASKFGKVVLSGTGGDEVFGGYPWRYYRAVVNDNFDSYIDKYYSFWQRLIPNETIKNLFRPIWSEVCNVSTRNLFRDVFATHADLLTSPEDYINHSLYFEAKTFLHGLLVVEDKLSMAHSLENRVPFLDNDLVDFAQSLPVNLKLGNLGEVVRINENEPGPKTQKFFEQTKDGKLILRKVMKRYIPNDITNLPKRGFSAPDASWFRGESIEFVKDMLLNPRARIYDYFDKKEVQMLLNQHIVGEKNLRLLIWSLLSMEVWLKKFQVN